MVEAAQRLKANLKLVGQACGWCGETFVLGDDAANCTTCGGRHHARCWDSSGGCSSKGCVNAPLQKLAQPAAGSVSAAVGAITCLTCGHYIQADAPRCPYCHAVQSPDGLYHGPQVRAPHALASLIYGLVGILVFGLILGIVAIGKSSQARRLIRENPRYTGEGLAIAGLVLGIIDIVGWVFLIFSRVKGMR